MATLKSRADKIKVFYYSAKKGFVQIHTVKDITMSRRIQDIRGVDYSMSLPSETELSITLEKYINGVHIEADIRFTGKNVNLMQLDGDMVLLVPFDVEKIFEKE